MAATTDLTRIGSILNDPKRPMKERFRALFTLKNLGGLQSIQEMCRAFQDNSALLKHEVAYCLGQMRDKRATEKLIEVLQDESREPIVRHEAGEALGAIGDIDFLPILEKFSSDKVPEVADTCGLAVERINYFKSENVKENLSTNPYNSVDPAPPSTETDIEKLRATLLDPNLPLFQRYRAMFSLRNIGTKECVLALAEGLNCKNDLFRHEIAYVLGQIQSDQAKNQLIQRLQDVKENPMVRHECAEALGSIANDEINKELEKYLGNDQPAVLRESCEVALDFAEYNLSLDFQYANAL